MLQTSLLFLRTADKDKNYNEELDLFLVKASRLSDFTTVLAICLLISILGLIGNGIIICLLCCIIKKTKFTIYVANLAAADFFALLRSFLSFLEFFTPFFINIRTRQLMSVMFYFGNETNSFFLAAMSIERCLDVFSPVWYQSYRRQCPTALVCASLWTMSVMRSVLNHFLCSPKYISSLNLGTSPCNVVTVLKYITTFVILAPIMLFSCLALVIRRKRKPQQDFPTRLDISIWVTVVLHLIFYPATNLIGFFLSYIQFSHYLNFYYLTLIFYCMGSTVNPFVYLFVGCWKREKFQEPFYMFLKRALKDERKVRIRTQPDQEPA